VLTFDPHPSKVLRPDKAAKMLMPLDDRISQMLSLGIDVVFVKTFTPEMAQTPAEAFVPGLKEVFPLLSSLHVGANFRFGVGRSGSVDTLVEDARKAGLETHILKGRIQEGEVISSSRIRLELEAGNIEQVNELLGYPYHVSGTITPGRQIGRQIGFPTLNINWHPESRPRYGVYKAWLLTGTGTTPLPGVANYGLKPTVGHSGEPVFEVHLIDPDRIPEVGARISVALTRFLRPERVFASVEELREQIARDVQEARGIDEPNVDFNRIGL
jgi:riboflavin kinase/FMN adenylyltransferase